MIIKSMSRKDASFGQLADYMLASRGATVALRRNLRVGAESRDGVVEDFVENHALLPRRANGNALFHEIIALPPDCGLPVKEQEAALREIATRYLDLRAPRQLAFGVIHTETAHVHIHLMISSNALMARKRAWLTKAEFTAIEREVEEYKLARFPGLGMRRHFDGSKQGAKRGRGEQALVRRTGAPSQKQELAVAVETAMKEAKSREALDMALRGLGLELYRRGRSVGLVTEGGRRYRLATLGLAEAFTDAVTRFDLVESRMASLRRGRPGRDREAEREI